MIAILLCTYNGSKYLSAQIDSILEQTYQNYVIYVHDDGSTDETLTIISSYMQKYPDRLVYKVDENKHRGAGASFMWLLQNIESDYYMFCDQDDIWLPTKIEHTFNKMKEMEKLYPSLPILIHSDLHITDCDLNITYDSFWKYQNFKVDLSKQKQYIAFGNIVTGCTMMINRMLKEVAFPYPSNLLHDYWLALKAAQYGKIDNIKEKTILYRQHGDNEAGVGSKYSKKRVSFFNFFANLSQELARYKMVSSGNMFGWFIHRVIYFFYRHLR